MKTIPFLILTAWLAILSASLFAQNSEPLYQPSQIRSAYTQATRDSSGKPGPNYYQNRAVYKISAEFNPQTNILTGTEIISYENHSNDTLSQICLNLFQNLYKKGSSRDGDADTANIHDGVEIRSLKVGGILIPREKFRTFSTIFTVSLKNRVMPHSTTTIEIEWKEKMPVTVAKRQGTYNKTNFFIAYWYPKMCVYDDIEGWNTAGYTGQAEFYSDFADYQVEITVPSAYTIWSSGTLMNGLEIYQDKIIQRIQLAAKSDSVIHVITEADRKENLITKSAVKHIWKFNSFNQADFAIGLSNTYLWDATSTIAGERRVLINSVYGSASVNCGLIPDIAGKAIRYYSLTSPAIPFPESAMTIFEGGPGGMEFPGMINQQNFKEPMETMMVTVHELGHAYLPFYAGINEQKYGWMDEGIFTLIGFNAFCDQIGDKDLKFLQMLGTKYSEDAASQAVDVPIMQMSYKLGDFTYGFITYVKPAAAFMLLSDYLGSEKFNTALKEFITRWKGLHPTPYDLFNTFNHISGEDLTWFWKPWFFEFGYCDLAIGTVKTSQDSNLVEILNIGSYPAPVNLVIKYADGSEKTFHEKMSCWKSGQTAITIAAPSGKISEISLNPNHFPESDYSNNQKRLSGN